MKSDEKRIAIITVIAIILLALFFSFAPTLKERTEKLKSYSKNYQNEEKKQEKESPFKAQFMSWDDRKSILYVDYYFINKQNIGVESVDIECHSFDKHRKELDILKKSFLIKMKKQSTEQFNSLKMGKISKKSEHIGCVVTNYK